MMNRNRFGRRAFLRGVGTVAVSLPLLDADLGTRAQADAEDPRRRVVILRHANGVAQANSTEPEQFWPAELGPITPKSLGADPSRAVSELAAYADKLLLVRGVRHGYPVVVCGHAEACAQILTGAGVEPIESEAQFCAQGESVDTRLAAALNPPGLDPLALMTGEAAFGIIAFRAPKQRRAFENNPWTCYARMVGLGGTDDALSAQIATKRKSVNDLVRSEMKDLLARKDLSSNDRRRLDLHFSAIRDVEIKLACQLPSLSSPELTSAELLNGDNYGRVTQLHMDLIALSFACNYSLVATLQLGTGSDGTQHIIPGFRDGQRLPGYHRISHRMDAEGGIGPAIEGALGMHHEIDKMHARLFRYLLDRLSAYALPAGNLLDSTLAVWVSDLGDGPNHSYENLPWVIAGGGGNFLKQGMYVDAGGVTNNKLLNTLLSAAGVRKPDGSLVDDFGDPRLDKGLIDAMRV